MDYGIALAPLRPHGPKWFREEMVEAIVDATRESFYFNVSIRMDGAAALWAMFRLLSDEPVDASKAAAAISTCMKDHMPPQAYDHVMRSIGGALATPTPLYLAAKKFSIDPNFPTNAKRS